MSVYGESEVNEKNNDISEQQVEAPMGVWKGRKKLFGDGDLKITNRI